MDAHTRTQYYLDEDKDTGTEIHDGSVVRFFVNGKVHVPPCVMKAQMRYVSVCMRVYACTRAFMFVCMSVCPFVCLSV